MEREFDYGERKFTVSITTALEIEVYDEKGKKLKNLPSPGFSGWFSLAVRLRPRLCRFCPLRCIFGICPIRLLFCILGLCHIRPLLCILGAWEQLEDYEITQPIEQLDRTVYYRTKENRPPCIGM